LAPPKGWAVGLLQAARSVFGAKGTEPDGGEVIFFRAG